MNGVGNTHLVGEFNFYGDPEGAKIVLDEYRTWEKIYDGNRKRGKKE